MSQPKSDRPKPPSTPGPGWGLPWGEAQAVTWVKGDHHDAPKTDTSDDATKAPDGR
jgi:hypothetical protein